MKNYLIFFLLLAIFARKAIGSESDSFTYRYKKLRDETKVLDKFINSLLDQAVEDANIFGKCSKVRILDAVSLQLAEASIFGIGKIEKYVCDSEKLDKHIIARSKSIFQDIKFFSGVAFYLYGLGPVIRIGNFHIGADKFGHFFYDSFKNYQKMVKAKGNVLKVLVHNQATEDGLFGLLMTGVYSYADISVNLHGMRFWHQLIARDKNIFHQSKLRKLSPLFTCINQKWVRSGNFTFKDYVDGSWDETINCNRYRDDDYRKKIALRIAQIKNRDGVPLSCPIPEYSCKKIAKKYGKYAKYTLNPYCLNL